MLRVPITTLPDALTTSVPGTEELMRTVHVPAADVGPLGPQVPPVIPPTPVDVDVIVTPDAGLQPVPLFFSTNTVKVCVVPTLLVAFGVIVIRASTHVFVLA